MEGSSSSPMQEVRAFVQMHTLTASNLRRHNTLIQPPKPALAPLAPAPAQQQPRPATRAALAARAPNVPAPPRPAAKHGGRKQRQRPLPEPQTAATTQQRAARPQPPKPVVDPHAWARYRATQLLAGALAKVVKWVAQAEVLEEMRAAVSLA